MSIIDGLLFISSLNLMDITFKERKKRLDCSKRMNIYQLELMNNLLPTGKKLETNRLSDAQINLIRRIENR